jgi:phage terminase small subunit
MADLTAKQAEFVQQYLVDLNATQAAIRAGYAESGARTEGARLLANADIADAIAEAQAERLSRVRIDQDYVLKQAVKLHERCMQEIEPETGPFGVLIRDAEGRVVYKFNAAGAAKALELVGKHVTIQAFREKIDHMSSDGTMSPQPPVYNITEK